MPFLEVFSKITYALFIVGSVIFGISIALNLLVVITVKRMTKTTNLRFEKTLSNAQKNDCLQIINSAEKEFAECMVEASEIKKVKRRNKVRKFFKLKEIQVPRQTHSVKNLFLNMVKDLSVPITQNSEKGYLSFTQKDVFNIARSVRVRIEEIITSSNVPWVKTLKLSFVLKCLDVYKVYSNVKQNALVTVAFHFFNFFMWVARVFNPVSMSKLIIKNASGSTLSSVLAKTTIEIVGKELAVLYYEKTYLSSEQKFQK